MAERLRPNLSHRVQKDMPVVIWFALSSANERVLILLIEVVDFVDNRRDRDWLQSSFTTERATRWY
jgi:hypothetical protein